MIFGLIRETSRILALAGSLAAIGPHFVLAQAPPQAAPGAVATPSLPFPTQLKKTVLVIQTNCLHEPTPEELAKMSPQQRADWTADAISKLTPEDIRKRPHDSVLGTGFLVSVPEPKLGKDTFFPYLVTNKHVVEPGVELGKPCKVSDYLLYMNRKAEAPSNGSYMQTIPIDSFDWTFSEDDSVDLAVTAFVPRPTEWDYLTIPLDVFATQEMIEDGEIVEGDPVIFSGLFIQYAGQTKLEPVVRSGTLAMLPTGTIETSLRKQGKVYLADAHVFGGNSGSPMMVDTLKFRTGVGSLYKLLGIVSAEVFETKELTIQTTTDFKATENANSDVSMVVPAPELRKILFSKKFVAQRELVIEQANHK